MGHAYDRAQALTTDETEALERFDDCADCGEDEGVRLFSGSDEGEALCLSCRIKRSDERIAETKRIAGLPAEEPLPAPADWALVAGYSRPDWADPFDD